jgi:hypothetical protein
MQRTPAMVLTHHDVVVQGCMVIPTDPGGAGVESAWEVREDLATFA